MVRLLRRNLERRVGAPPTAPSETLDKHPHPCAPVSSSDDGVTSPLAEWLPGLREVPPRA